MAAKPLWGMSAVCEVAAALHVGAVSAAPSAIEEQTTTLSGVYTETQASRGETLYADNCSYCHLNDLSGGELAPALTGAMFVGRWSERNLGELFDYMRVAMPLNSPGGLSATQNADLLAFLLYRTGYPAGTGELPANSDGLATISLAARP